MIRLKKTIFERWILVDAEDPFRAWSGSRFVEIDEHGFGISVQVSNFDSREAALLYARTFGFEVAEA